MRISNAHQPGKKILGLISFAEGRDDSPSWLLQYYESGRLYTIDLGIGSPEAVMAAIADAADFLECRPENIQVGDEPLSDSDADERGPEARLRLEKVRAVGEPRARIYYAQDDVLRPGWYVQFYSNEKLDRLPLWQAELEDVEAARTEAAWMLGCRPDEIQVGGELFDWPNKRR
jgi:hypothetical protein